MPRLLFFTPVLPGLTGQGTAIRAGVALQVLAEKFDVTVVHVDLWTGEPILADREWPRKLATAYHFVPTPVAPNAAEKLARELVVNTIFDAVYVFRLVVAPFALRVTGLISKLPIPNVIDLDDDECARTEQFIALREAGKTSQGGPAKDIERTHRERAEMHRQRGFARLMLLRFDHALLASRGDMNAMSLLYPDRTFSLLPNVMRVPQNAPKTLEATGSLLFLGTLDYLPNEDAVLYFAGSILPLLLLEGRQGLEFRVVGIKTPQSIEGLRDRAGVTIVGPVRDVAEEYGRARIAVVPLRAGSGTRIKILEAFRFGVPVVSTSLGASGLEVCDGVHLLIADTPEAFAKACLRVIEDDVLASTLARNAFEWLCATHSLDRARDVLHNLIVDGSEEQTSVPAGAALQQALTGRGGRIS